MTLKNYFELFDLPTQYRIDTKILESAYLSLQQQVHPDRFAQATDTDRRVSLQWASFANEAYQNLRYPLKRAIHLLNLHGYDAKTPSSTSLDKEFLVQQMQWRELLEEASLAGDEAQLLRLQKEVGDTEGLYIERIARLLDDARDFDLANIAVQELMFIDKFKSEIADAIDQLVI
ncbi:MAG: Fe-S protein assembly co-chaperone HscB [Burkholderiaceae bacterium]|nr:Fe-S protein assembly co-chaperone HscB [Burkholderiaceae bacterium]